MTSNKGRNDQIDYLLSRGTFELQSLLQEAQAIGWAV